VLVREESESDACNHADACDDEVVIAWSTAAAAIAILRRGGESESEAAFGFV